MNSIILIFHYNNWGCELCNLIKWLLLAFAMFFSGFIYVIIKTADTFDGREYSRSDYVHYYFITPDLFMEPPNIPGIITYYSEGDDNYGYFQRSITWSDVADVPAAEKIIEQFFISKGYTKRKDGLVWRFYWSNYVPDPKTCDNEQYSTVWGYHEISIELITGTRGC
ncbi:hypothetical protein RABR111495_02955 [Rahnella bruchi]